MANTNELSGLVEILEKREINIKYYLALQQIMAEDFEKAIPYVREYLDLDGPHYPWAIDTPLLERLNKVGYEKFLEDLIRITDGEEKREEKLKDCIPRFIHVSEIYDKKKVAWLLAKSYC